MLSVSQLIRFWGLRKLLIHHHLRYKPESKNHILHTTTTNNILISRLTQPLRIQLYKDLHTNITRTGTLCVKSACVFTAKKFHRSCEKIVSYCLCFTILLIRRQKKSRGNGTDLSSQTRGVVHRQYIHVASTCQL